MRPPEGGSRGAVGDDLDCIPAEDHRGTERGEHQARPPAPPHVGAVVSPHVAADGDAESKEERWCGQHVRVLGEALPGVCLLTEFALGAREVAQVTVGRPGDDGEAEADSQCPTLEGTRVIFLEAQGCDFRP